MTNKIPENMRHLFDGYDGESKPSKHYITALIAPKPPEIRQRVAEREKQLESNLLYIENEGALFRGPARGVPLYIWSSHECKFVPYKLAGQPKPIDWGNVIDEIEAKRLMRDQINS